MISNLFGAFTGTGAPFAYAIILVFCYGLSIWIERWRTFAGWKFSTEQERTLRSAIQHGSWMEAKSVAQGHPVQAFLDASEDSAQRTWDDMALVAPLVENRVTQRISALSMVANLSTMLGLLGTVYGLIYALDGLDDASNIERTARLSSGIGAAMLTTAWGLIAGLPMMFAHNLLQGQSDRILALCQSIAAQIVLSAKNPSSQVSTHASSVVDSE